MAITEITRLENKSRGTVSLHNIEVPTTPGHGVAVRPGDRLDVAMFVPWATDAAQFVRQHLEVHMDGVPRYWIWQAAHWDGDHVRFARDGAWRAPGTRMHGISAVEGTRTIVVHDNCIEVVSLPDDDIRRFVDSLPPASWVPSAAQPLDPGLLAVPSVPRSTATAFSMAGPPSDAFARGLPEARFRYTDSGKRYGFAIDAAGLVTATHPDGTRTPLPDAVSYDRLRRGETITPAPPFDLVAANDSRVIAKERGRNRFFFTTMDDLFVHGDGFGGELVVPSMYFKIDPEFAAPGRRAEDLTDHMAGCFADHPAVERFPVFRMLLGLQRSDMMVVRVRPRVWHLIDARPPLENYELYSRLLAFAATTLSAATGVLAQWPPLGPLRTFLAGLEQAVRVQQAARAEVGFDAYELPGYVNGQDEAGRVDAVPHRQYTDGTRTLTYKSIRSYGVLDLGVGHAHWHAVEDGSTGGELQPMHAGVAFAGLSWAEAYRLVNGPIADGDGYIDGTANFYALAQLRPDGELGTARGRGVPDAFGILYVDEQTYFNGRWRLAHPDDHAGGGFALVTALAKPPADRPTPLDRFDAAAFWCPFRAGAVDRRSRMAVSRQVLAVTAAEGVAEVYTINFSFASMDHTWRWRPLPPSARVAYFPDEASAADEQLPAGLTGDVVYPQTVRLREDMTLHLRGTRGGVPGRWYQRYLPAGNQLPPISQRQPGGKPAQAFGHPWKFMAESAWTAADRFSHLGVHVAVDSRSQYYRLDVPAAAASVLAKSSPDRPWTDVTGELFVRALRFWWAAPVRVPNLDPALQLLPVRPARRTPPSLFNPVTQLRIVQRGGAWIAMHWDKRDDDLLPFDRREDWLGIPVDVKPITLAQDGQRLQLTVGANVRVPGGPVVRTASVAWTGDPTAPLALQVRDPRDVWRVRLAAMPPAADGRPGPPVVLRTVELTQFREGSDGVLEHRWKPADADLAALQRVCSTAGAVEFGTSVWVEDVVGRVAVPDSVAFVRPLRVSIQPQQAPIGVPVTVLVTANDALTGAPVQGVVNVGTSGVGPTGTPFPTTFVMGTRRVFDPEIRQYVTEEVPPVVTVSATGYATARVDVQLHPPELRARVDQPWLPVGRPAQVTVHATDAVTGTGVAGRVLLNGADVGATGSPFTVTSGPTAPAATVRAPYYPDAGIPWPPLRVPQLAASVAPYPVPLRTAVAVTVRAVDVDTQAPVAGTVTVDGVAVGPTNTAFTYTFVPRRVTVFDPEIRRNRIELVMPVGAVTAPGYPAVELALF